ncbi:MAG: trypsin-like serine peptidase [Micromonosporaceae bacterium]
MRRQLLKTGALTAASGLLLLAFTGVASAAPVAGDGAATSHRAADTASQQRHVAEHWTTKRMRNATPMEQLLDSGRRSSGPIATGKATTVKPTLPATDAVEPAAFPHAGGPWTGGGAIVKTEGRVFFTYQGRSASCSGTAVTSANKSTVITAGHCVKLDGAWHTNWAFAPAYDNGSTPYGTWTAKSTHSTPQWVASEDINYDVGAAAVNPLNGALLTDVVGGQGVAFNQARSQAMYAFGYPAAAPYDGTKLIYCSGVTFDALISDGIGMDCDMTGGASGGGWLMNFNESTGAGIVNSVNSYKINFIPYWMFGPYFGADAQTLYNTAQAS